MSIFNQGQLITASGVQQLERNFASASAPSNPEVGQLWYDTPNTSLKIYTGVAWISVAPTSVTSLTAGAGITLSGSTGDVTISATGGGAGLNGTWHNVTGSRALGVTYTNSYSTPIGLSVYGGASGTSGVAVYVNGTLIYFNQAQWNGAGAYPGAFTIVPPGATYYVSFTSSGLSGWFELY